MSEALSEVFEQLQQNAEKKRKTRAKKTEEVLDNKKPKSAKKLTKKEVQIRVLAEQTVMPDYYETVWTTDQLDELCRWLAENPTVAVDTETLGVKAFQDKIVGISFYAPKKGWYIPLMHIDDIKDEVPADVFDELGNRLRAARVGVDYVKCLNQTMVADRLRPLLEDREKKFLGHNCKFDSHILWNWMGIDIRWFYDTMIGQAILDETKSKRLKDIAPLYLGVEAETFGSLFGKVTFDKVPVLMDPETRTGCLGGYYAIKDTELTFDLAKYQIRHLYNPKLNKLRELFFDVEMPFLQIVVEAERQGVALDSDYLVNKVAVDLHADLERLRQKIWAVTGQINLNAPAQLAEALYIKLGLPRVNTDKPNSTDKKTLSKLRKATGNAIIIDIAEYKEKAKLTQAFADKLPKAVVNGRVHASFGQVTAKTGRMGCSAPNLQQIPSRVGGLIRNAFVSDEGRLLASIDYSQQEIRVLAHVSQDEVLLDAYKKGLDIHSLTATGMFNSSYPEYGKVTYEQFEYWRGVPDLFIGEDGSVLEEKFNTENVEKLFSEGKIDTKDIAELHEQIDRGKKAEKVRKNAKVVNFGIIYGMSKYKLADTLDITTDEAQAYIDAYFAQYPGVRAWMESQRKKMREMHYTETLLGRKRRVRADMLAPEFWKIQAGFRQGINAVIQGSSADMTKLASIQLQPLLKELGVKIILWVHDEVVFDVPENIGMENLQRIAHVMQNAIPLDCGMKSDIEVARKWGQKMSVEKVEELAIRNVFSDEENEDDGVEDEVA